MTKSLATLTAEARRLSILQTLQNAIEYTINLDLLCDHLHVGIMTMVDEMQWLEDHGLAELDQIDGITKVRLTRLGKDIAAGREQLLGVRRPDPQ
jgi:hypothetical protein